MESLKRILAKRQALLTVFICALMAVMSIVAATATQSIGSEPARASVFSSGAAMSAALPEIQQAL